MATAQLTLTDLNPTRITVSSSLDPTRSSDSEILHRDMELGQLMLVGIRNALPDIYRSVREIHKEFHPELYDNG